MDSPEQEVRRLALERATELYGELKHLESNDELAVATTKELPVHIKIAQDLEPEEAPIPEKKTVDPNTMLIAGASLLGTVLVLAYEHVLPIAGKAFGTIIRPRI